MTLKSGDERLQLIPVLTTMLKFSPDEKDKMTAIAAGQFTSFSCTSFMTFSCTIFMSYPA